MQAPFLMQLRSQRRATARHVSRVGRGNVAARGAPIFVASFVDKVDDEVGMWSKPTLGVRQRAWNGGRIGTPFSLSFALSMLARGDGSACCRPPPRAFLPPPLAPPSHTCRSVRQPHWIAGIRKPDSTADSRSGCRSEDAKTIEGPTRQVGPGVSAGFVPEGKRAVPSDRLILGQQRRGFDHRLGHNQAIEGGARPCLLQRFLHNVQKGGQPTPQPDGVAIEGRMEFGWVNERTGLLWWREMAPTLNLRSSADSYGLA